MLPDPATFIGLYRSLMSRPARPALGVGGFGWRWVHRKYFGLPSSKRRRHPPPLPDDCRSPQRLSAVFSLFPYQRGSSQQSRLLSLDHGDSLCLYVCFQIIRQWFKCTNTGRPTFCMQPSSFIFLPTFGVSCHVEPVQWLSTAAGTSVPFLGLGLSVGIIDLF